MARFNHLLSPIASSQAVIAVRNRLDDPMFWRRTGTVVTWSALGVLAFVPEAYAAFPIPGLQRLVTDTQDTVTNEGGTAGATLGIGAAAVRMALSNFEMGIGKFCTTAAGGATVGSAPELSTYLTGA